jgi:hypothetical protein
MIIPPKPVEAPDRRSGQVRRKNKDPTVMDGGVLQKAGIRAPARNALLRNGTRGTRGARGFVVAGSSSDATRHNGSAGDGSGGDSTTPSNRSSIRSGGRLLEDLAQGRGLGHQSPSGEQCDEQRSDVYFHAYLPNGLTPQLI